MMLAEEIEASARRDAEDGPVAGDLISSQHDAVSTRLQKQVANGSLVEMAQA